MNVNCINMYAMQQAQQVYQSHILTSKVHGDQRMREVYRQQPVFVDELARKTELVVRKVLPRVEAYEHTQSSASQSAQARSGVYAPAQRDKESKYTLATAAEAATEEPFRAINSYNYIQHNVSSLRHYTHKAVEAYSTATYEDTYTYHSYGSFDITY